MKKWKGICGTIRRYRLSGNKPHRVYKPRIVDGKVMMPADLRRLISTCSVLSTSTLSRMKCEPWSKASGRKWRTSCRRSSRRIDHGNRCRCLLYPRYCCKSLFALVITIPPGCRRDFRVKMWGTSSPDDKLTGDLGNVIETTQIGGRRSDRLTAGNLSPGNFGLLQHNLPIATECSAAKSTAYSITSSARASSVSGTVRLSALAVLRLMISSNLVA